MPEKLKKESKKKQQDTKDPASRLKDYGRYSSMALQMGVTIGIGVWGGMKLDQYFPLGKIPVFTVLLSLVSVFAAMYLAVKDLGRK